MTFILQILDNLLFWIWMILTTGPSLLQTLLLEHTIQTMCKLVATRLFLIVELLLLTSPLLWLPALLTLCLMELLMIIIKEFTMWTAVPSEACHQSGCKSTNTGSRFLLILMLFLWKMPMDHIAFWDSSRTHKIIGF